MRTAEPAKSRPGFPWAILVFGLAALTVLLSLGHWQQQRLEWKEGLLAQISSRIEATPQAIDDVLMQFDRTGDIDYVPVTVKGRFLHEHELHFLATHRGQSGWYVYTPLQRGDGTAVLVNRGFVPYDYKDARTRENGQAGGEVTVTGLSRNPLAAKPSLLVPDNDPVGNVFYWKDLAAMWERTGLEDRLSVAPIFVDANNAENPGGLPIGGVTRVELPNNHLQYALTWYGLAAALAAVLTAYLWRWKQAGRNLSRPGAPANS